MNWNLSSHLPELYSAALLALLVGFVFVSYAAWMIWQRGWRNSARSMERRYATLAQRFPMWRANLTSLHRATTTSTLCSKCIFHTKTEGNLILCCARTDDVFAPRQPVIECGTYRNWFSIKQALVTSTLVCAAFIGLFVYIMRPPDYQTLHNLRVLDSLAINQFVLASLDRDSGEWNQFQANFCSSYVLPPELYAKKPIRLLKYRRDLVNNCWDISDRKAGIIFERSN